MGSKKLEATVTEIFSFWMEIKQSLFSFLSHMNSIEFLFSVASVLFGCIGNIHSCVNNVEARLFSFIQKS